MRLLRMASGGLLFLVVALAVTLGIAVGLLGIPAADLPAFAWLLAIAGGSVGILALLLAQPVVIGRISGIRAQLIGASLVASMLLLVMLMAFAQAMFISRHDLAVLLTMLIFAALLAVGFSFLWAAPIASRIERVREGTARLAHGELDASLPVQGQDELADLARSFNEMANALKRAALREREIEQARRDLVAAVSHDLRTPLASTLALVEALADDVTADPETERRYLRSIQHEIEHLSRLVDDLFELAQIDAGVLRLHLERGSLHDLISDTLATLQPHAERQGVRLIGEVNAAVDPVLMSPPKLQRVFHNLIGNALRHTAPDGTILLRAAPRGNLVQVEVTDTGEGITPEDLPHVFDRSFRGERSRSRTMEGSAGAGLGLTIAQGLIEAHGGTISVESAPGLGAKFCFTLQRA